jgi:outer membrane protein TolC
MMDMPEHRWTVGVAFNLPIQTGARSGAKEEALALRAQFQSEAQSMENSARREEFVARKELQQSRAVLDVFEKKLLPIAKNQIDAANAGFIASRNPFTAVIDAAHKLHAAELDYQMARATLVTRRAELDRALGRVPGLDWKEEQQ